MTMRKMLSVLLIFAMILSCFWVQTAGAGETEAKTGKRDYIVVAKDKNAFESQSNKNANKIDREKTNEWLQKSNIIVVEMTGDEAAALAKDSDVAMVEEDIIVSLNSLDNRELQSEEENEIPPEQVIPWNIQAVKGSPEYIGSGDGQGRVKTGILDSGIEIMSEIDVAERINFVGEDTGAFLSMYEDMTGHGTSVAGIIGARDNEEGVIGIDPNAYLCSLKVFDNENKAPLSRILGGIQYAIDNDIKILNMSFGTTVDSAILHSKLQEAYEAGMLLIASAGNDGMVEFPAAYDEVIAVGASTTDNEVAPFSQVGTPVEILAPGTEILSTSLMGGYAVSEGTSMSAPHVAAAASLLWAKDVTRSNDFIRQLLDVSARKLDAGNSGNGLLDVAYAIEIYDQFSEVYTSGEIAYDEIPVNQSDLEISEGGYVVGSWGGDSHDKTITDSGYLLDYVANIKAASRYADSGTYKATGNSDPIYIILHGGTVVGTIENYNKSFAAREGQNYVSDIRYLYELACYYFNNQIGYKGTKLTLPSTSIQYVSNSNGEFGLIINDLLKHFYGVKGRNLTYEEVSSYILGYAVHLAGDVYAHRALVPNSSGITASYFNQGTCSHTNADINKQAFLRTLSSGNLCNHYSSLVSLINVGVIETKDISTWGGSDSDTVRTLYEDNANYLPKRFEGALFTVKYIMGRFRSCAELTKSLFLPNINGVTGYNINLNGLYKFYQQTGWSTTDLYGGTATNGLR